MSVSGKYWVATPREVYAVYRSSSESIHHNDLCVTIPLDIAEHAFVDPQILAAHSQGPASLSLPCFIGARVERLFERIRQSARRETGQRSAVVDRKFLIDVV